MNHSQLKHLERLLADSPLRRPDPFGLAMPGSIFGMDVTIAPEIPRYTLPAEVLPGISWPAGFREGINRWSESFLGTRSMLPMGTAYLIGGSRLVMRPADVVKLDNMF